MKILQTLSKIFLLSTSPGSFSEGEEERWQDSEWQSGARVLARGAAAARRGERAGAVPRARARAPPPRQEALCLPGHTGGTVK